MKMKLNIFAGLCLVACFVVIPVIAQETAEQDKPVESVEQTTEEPKDTDESNADAGVSADAGPEQPKPETPEPEEPPPPTPAEELPTSVDAPGFADIDNPKYSLPFSKGDTEFGLSMAMAGSGDYFYLGAGASFDYFVIDRLAPGIEIQYTHIFLDQDFGYSEPHTMTLLPFLKFVILRSGSIAPYLVVAGGYQFEWGSKYAVNAWTVGGGAGVNVGISEHFALNIQLLALYYWYDGTRVYGYSDDRIYTASNGIDYVCQSADQCDYDNGIFAYKSPDGEFIFCDGPQADEDACLYQTVYRCDENGQNCIPPYSDPADKKSEMFFPLITFGVSFFF